MRLHPDLVAKIEEEPEEEPPLRYQYIRLKLAVEYPIAKGFYVVSTIAYRGRLSNHTEASSAIRRGYNNTFASIGIGYVLGKK